MATVVGMTAAKILELLDTTVSGIELDPVSGQLVFQLKSGAETTVGNLVTTNTDQQIANSKFFTGELRPPIVSGVTAATPASSWKLGISLLAGSTPDGWPVNGLVETIRHSTGRTIQRCTEHRTGGANVFVRSENTDGSWTPWLQVDSEPTAWFTPGISNGANVSDTAYRRVGDIVEIRGAIQHNEGGTHLLFNLPENYRPPTMRRFLSATQTHNLGYVLVNQVDGAVSLVKSVATWEYWTLDGIFFATS